MVIDGYKQTDIGVIPEDWEVNLIGNIFEFKNGLNKAKEFFGYGTPIINYMDVFKHYGLKVNDIIGKVDVTKEELTAYNVKKGDVFFTRTSETVDEIGITTVIVEDVQDTVFSGFILRARPIRDDLDLNYKKYCFSMQNIRKQIISTASYTTRALTNGKSLSKVQIPIPPKEEQKAIAKALSDTDELITSLEKLISKKEAIKQGTMQQLLTGKKRLSGFSGEWEEKRLGDFLDYEQPTNYLVSSTKYTDNGEVPVLTAGKTFILGYTSEENGIFNNLPAIIFDDFTTASKYVDFPFKAKSSAMKMLIPKNDKVNMRFIYEIMSQIKYQVGDHKRHWIAELSNLEILVPPTSEEQQAIAKILSDIDNEIESLKSKLSKTKAIKDGMMSELLTGKTRLKVKDE